ncbi:MAG: hypothetical protein M3Y21_04705 [Candidatus Eremiobacteraeota bacterium]|nr:hypothetical protein [Candidatus Eremiobacteraeota bacterium]
MNDKIQSLGRIFHRSDYGGSPYEPVRGVVVLSIDFDHQFIRRNGVEGTRKMIVGVMNMVLEGYIAGARRGFVSIESIRRAVTRAMGVVAIRCLSLDGRTADLELPPNVKLPCPEAIDMRDVRIV